MARKTTAKTKPKAAAKAKPKVKARAKPKAIAAKKPVASKSQPATRRIVETTTFREGKTGKVIHMDLKTKPAGKIITASVGGRVKSVAISR